MLIIFGVMCGFFGKRLVRPVAFTAGFLTGAEMMTMFGQFRLYSLAPANLAVVCGVGGVSLGVLAVIFYRAVIFGLLGAIAASIVVLVCQEYAVRLVLQVVFGVSTFVLGSFCASLLPSFSTIVVTACLGSYLLTTGIDCIIKSGFNHIFAFGLGYRWESIKDNTTDEIFGLMAFWLLLFLWMCARQLLASKPVKKPPCKIVET